MTTHLNHVDYVKKVCCARKDFSPERKKKLPVLPKITEKMIVVSYELVFTRVIEQMEVVRLNSVKSGAERSCRNAERGQGHTFRNPLSRLRKILLLLGRLERGNSKM